MNGGAMKNNWIITPETITHQSEPGFTAYWHSGPVDLDGIEGAFWQDEDCAGEDDRITLYGFEWSGPPPDYERFETLMRSASFALDDWIAERL